MQTKTTSMRVPEKGRPRPLLGELQGALKVMSLWLFFFLKPYSPLWQFVGLCTGWCTLGFGINYWINWIFIFWLVTICSLSQRKPCKLTLLWWFYFCTCWVMIFTTSGIIYSCNPIFTPNAAKVSKRLEVIRFLCEPGSLGSEIGGGECRDQAEVQATLW